MKECVSMLPLFVLTAQLNRLNFLGNPRTQIRLLATGQSKTKQKRSNKKSLNMSFSPYLKFPISDTSIALISIL